MRKGVSALGLILGLFLFLVLVGLIYELQGGLLRATRGSVEDALNKTDQPIPVLNNLPSQTGNPLILPPSGDIDWNQEPKLDSLSREKKINAQKIVDLAKEEGVSPLLMVALAQQESSFLHTVNGQVRDSGVGGSKGILQVTANTAYGQHAPLEYEGTSTGCYSLMSCSSANPCPCKDLDYCEIEGNIRCGIRIFKDKMRVMQDDQRYENSVRKNCKIQPYTDQYLSYKGDLVKKALRYYNGLGCDGPVINADENYVERIIQRAQNFR